MTSSSRRQESFSARRRGLGETHIELAAVELAAVERHEFIHGGDCRTDGARGTVDRRQREVQGRLVEAPGKITAVSRLGRYSSSETLNSKRLASGIKLHHKNHDSSMPTVIIGEERFHPYHRYRHPRLPGTPGWTRATRQASPRLRTVRTRC